MPNPTGNRVTQREKNGWDRRKQKIPFDRRGPRPKRPKHPNLPKHVRKQIELMPEVEKVCQQAGLKKQSEHKRGTDYTFRFQRQRVKKTVKVDFKYCFGALGPDTIQARLRNVNGKKRGELINNANWMMAYDGKNTLYFFQTSVIDVYLKKCWGRVSKQHAVNKGSYTEYPVNLPDAFWHTRINPIKVDFSKEGIQSALKQIKDAEIPPSPKTKRTPFQKITNPRLTNGNNHTRKPELRRTGTRGK